jgi:hypothetical protein
MKANETKSVHVTFTTKRDTCPPVHINDVQLPWTSSRPPPYLAHTHIFAKRKQLGLSLTRMYWLLGRKSKLSTNNKLLVNKVILKPIWTYGIQLWGTTSNSNFEILERFQSSLVANSGCPLVRVKFRHP